MNKLALLALLVPSLALADDFQVIDRGNAVEVIAHNVTATRTGVMPIRSRLEVPLAPNHGKLVGLLPKDSTIKIVEIEDGNLSVKVGYEHPGVVTLAKFAQATQVGPDVHLIFPRAVPADGAAIVMPEPTIPPELAKKIEAVAPVIGPPPPPKPVEAAKPVEAPKPVVAEAPKPVVVEKTVEKTEEKPAAAVVEPKAEEKKPEPKTEEKKPADKKPATIKETKPEDGFSKLAMYGAVALVGVGIGGWLLKKRKAQQDPTTTIDVIAQKSLGGKAKVVWFTVGGREMVVAVTPTAVRMLSSWKAGAKAENANTANINLPVAEAKPASSSAVAGLLKLREKAGPAFTKLDDDVATDDIDADAQWAKEILAATAGAKR